MNESHYLFGNEGCIFYLACKSFYIT
jgi:hypothetical protein